MTQTITKDRTETIHAAYILAAPLYDPSETYRPWVPLTDLRAELGDTLTRAETDKALFELFIGRTIRLISEVNRKAIDAELQEGAAYIGGDYKHLIRWNC